MTNPDRSHLCVLGLYACRWLETGREISVRHRGGFLAHLLPPVITGNDTKDKQVSEMDNE